MLSLPITFTSVIGVFVPVFSRPVWQHVKVLLPGAVFAPGKRTVTAILQIMGRSAAPDFQTSHRVLNRAVWSPLKASRLLLRLLVAVFIPPGVVVCGLDDTMSAVAARRSPPKASTAIPSAPRTRIWSKPVACAGSRVCC
jgi:DDE superfamily endonuclease